MLEVSALPSSLTLDESHTVLIHFYSNQEGTIPTLELYIEIFLVEEYQVDHFEILDTSPLIPKAELYLYFTSNGRLAEHFLPRLMDWQQCLNNILNSIRDLAALVE